MNLYLLKKKAKNDIIKIVKPKMEEKNEKRKKNIYNIVNFYYVVIINTK